MILSEFVKNTLLEINKGISEAQNESTNGFIINPLNVKNIAQTESIEFNVIIDVGEDSQGVGGIGVKAEIFNIGVSGTENIKNNTQTSINFKNTSDIYYK